MHSFLLGKEGDGVREIATILNITRVHTAITSLGFFGRGLAIAKGICRSERNGWEGKQESFERCTPACPYASSDDFIVPGEYALCVLCCLLSWLIGSLAILENFTEELRVGTASTADTGSSTIDYAVIVVLNNLYFSDMQLTLDSVLTPCLKAVTARASISGLQECMEALGGVGYLENEESQHINVARLYRDVNVLSIWEGTTNVLGTDFVKTFNGRNSKPTLKALRSWLQTRTFRIKPNR